MTYEQEALVRPRRGRLHGRRRLSRRTRFSRSTRSSSSERNVAAADGRSLWRFAHFLWSEEAQRIFVRYGLSQRRRGLNAATPRSAGSQTPSASPISAAGSARDEGHRGRGLEESGHESGEADRERDRRRDRPHGRAGDGAGLLRRAALLPLHPDAAGGRLRLRLPGRPRRLCGRRSSSREALFALRFSPSRSPSRTAAVNAVLGTYAAYVLSRYRFRGQRPLGIIVNLPVAIPTVVVGTSLLLLWGPIGLLGRLLDPLGIQPMFAPAGVLLAHLFVTFPYMLGRGQAGPRRARRDLRGGGLHDRRERAADLPLGRSCRPCAAVSSPVPC